MNEKILSGIERDRQEMIENTIRLIRIPSVSEDMGQCKKAIRLMTELAKEMGMHSYTVLDGRIGIVEIGSGEETIGVLVHVDVVPPGDEALWEQDPFDGFVKDGFLYGRGAVDDKGPCIACLYAMKAVLECGEPLKKKIQMIIGSQEEVEWTDMDDYVERFPLPDYGFTPDGSFPVINIEKGYIDVYTYFDMALQSEGAKIHELTGGESVNSIPGSASARILNMDENGNTSSCGELVVAQGKSAHSSVPEQGDNAIERLCHMLSERDLAKSPARNAIAFVEDCFYMRVHGEGLGFQMQKEDKYYNGEFIDVTVICPTMVSQDDDKVTVVFNVRTSWGTKLEDIVKAFENKAQQYGFTLACKNVLEPLYVHKERPFLKVMNKAYEKVSGLAGGFVLAHGTSYAKAMPNMVAWGPVFPEEEDRSHQANERFCIETMMKGAKMSALALHEMAVSDESFK